MNNLVYCTNNTRLIGKESYLYLPSGWLSPPRYEGREIPVKWYRGLYVISDMFIWYDGKSIWRISGDDSMLAIDISVPSYQYYWQFFQNNPDTRLWHHSGSGLIAMAERVSREQLRLEAIFL